MSEITILNTSLSQQGRIDNYESLICTRKHGDISSMLIVADSAINNAEYLIKDNIIYLNDKNSEYPNNINYPCCITQSKESFGSTNKKEIISHDVLWVLSGRLANITGAAITYTDETVEYIIKDLITTVLDGDRDLSYLSVVANEDRGSTITLSIPPGAKLGDYIKTLLSIDEMGLIATVGESTLEIDIYEGVDRSDENGVVPPVIFSIDFNNLESGEKLSSKTDVVNYVYVYGGLDEGGDRTVVEVGSATGNNRREGIVDGGDSTDTDELTALGQAVLTTEENSGSYEVSSLIGTDHQTFTYGVHYFLGDIVTVEGEDLRIVQAEEVYQSQTGHKIHLTFGSIESGNSDMLKDLNIRVSRLETKPTSSGGSAVNPNILINSNFLVNQRVVSGTVILSSNVYGHDRWKAGASGCTYTFATSNGVTTITITAGSLIQTIEDLNLGPGNHTLSWTGTAQGKLNGGSYGSSPVTETVTGGSNVEVEFGTGTVIKPKVEIGSSATQYIYENIADEIFKCMRYFEKSYSCDVAVGTATENGCVLEYDIRNSVQMAGYQFKVCKRIVPTCQCYSTETGTAGKVYNNGDISGTITRIATTGFSSLATTGGSTAYQAKYHFTADAEIY
jgi:hypothetical protein